MAKDNGVREVYVHAFLDGRDVPPRSAETYLALLEEKAGEIGVGRIASITGRYWAMDRDNRWDRVDKAYRLLTRVRTPRSGLGALCSLTPKTSRRL